jgi:hypothetical protein
MITQVPSKKQQNPHAHWSFLPSAIAGGLGVAIGIVLGNFLGLI